MRKFIEEIRESEENVRKRWLIGLSSVTMIVVIGLWLGYINIIVRPVEDVESARREALNKEPGFTETFGVGFNTVFGQLKTSAKSALGYLGNTFNYSNEINITRENFDRNFILDSLEKIPRTKLP